jgi:hypothetical protein
LGSGHHGQFEQQYGSWIARLKSRANHFSITYEKVTTALRHPVPQRRFAGEVYAGVNYVEAALAPKSALNSA